MIKKELQLLLDREKIKSDILQKQLDRTMETLEIVVEQRDQLKITMKEREDEYENRNTKMWMWWKR